MWHREDDSGACPALAAVQKQILALGLIWPMCYGRMGGQESPIDLRGRISNIERAYYV